jgi:hypothetical protein
MASSEGGAMSGEFSPRTYQIVIEGIADNFFIHPHFRAFVETDSASPTVMMTTNNVTEPDKVDFQTAMGGRRSDDGRSGIFIYMRWTDTPRMGDAVTVTVWQDGASRYGRPEALPEAGFDASAPTAIFEQGHVRPPAAV